MSSNVGVGSGENVAGLDAGENYWSSTESSASNAYQLFGNNPAVTVTQSKTTPNNVRAVRAF